jgi:predicted ATPase
VLQDDPTDETIYRALMRAYAASGRREDALRQVERCAAALRDELGVEPSDETQALAAEIRSAPVQPTAPATTVTRINNLPAAPNSLVGRGREVELLLDLVCRPDVRLVSVTGPGGVGKTRLALETASLAADEFSGGVCFVSLAAISRPELVMPSVAHALALEASGDRDAAEVVRAALREQNILLVLDNFEHVLDAATDIADLLAAAPSLSVLVTSREPLHLRSEHEIVLSPLPAPNPERRLTAGSLSRYPAVELFVQRAEAVNRSFALTDENAQAVGVLCARLDGLPLAIELAAARARHLEPEALVSGLDDRFALLTGGFRDLPPRQRTMRAAIAWSYDLLDPAEQQLFRRLSIFAGGFTDDAAEAVAGDEGVRGLGGKEHSSPAYPLTPSPPFLDRIAALTEKGLLRVEQGDDALRHGMLETIREFGLDALAESGERDAIARAHAEWFLALAERALPELTGPTQSQWLERFDLEHANVRVALAFLLDAPDGVDAALRLAAAMWRFWWGRGHAREGFSWLERALARPGSANIARVRALDAAGEMAYAVADYQRADSWYAEALTIARPLNDARGMANALNGIGLISRIRGDLARAGTLHEEALQILRELGDARGIASALNNLGAVAYFRADTTWAESLWQEAADIVRQLGDTRGLISVLGNLGAVALMEGNLDKAAAIQEEVLSSARRVGDVVGTTRALINLGGVLFERGDLARATERFDEALIRSRENGDASAEAIVLYNLGQVAEREGRPADAAMRLGESLIIFRRVNDLPGAVAGIERLAVLASADGRSEQAARLFAAAAIIRKSTGAARDPSDQPAYDRAVESCRAALGDDAFALVWAAGAALSVQDATAEALASASPDPAAVR